MISSKSISLALAALVLVVLAGASSAFAQTVAFNVSTAPTFVANTGRSEVLGQVTMTADATCGTNADGLCVSTAGTIQILYVGTPIDNNIATAGIGLQTTNGIEVCENIALVVTCNALGTYITPAFTATNTTAGGVVSFGVVGLIDFAAGDQVVIRGVRGQIDLSPGNVVGTSLIGQLTASPSTIAGFQPTSEVVARSADPLTMAFGAWTILQCLPNVGTGTVTVTEGFNTAFVDDDADPADVTAGTLNLRPNFGASGITGVRVLRNSRINIVITGLPSGVTITWPGASAVDSGTGATGAALALVSQSSSGDTATYVFSTLDMAVSDINGERFVITLTAAVNIALSNTPNDFGSTTGQGRMFDAHTSTSQPRYNHPLEPVPGAPWLTVAPCTTNLLFPWVINVNPGLDSGLAIANTTMDPYGTLGQTGSCTLTLYPTSLTTTEGVNAGPGIPLTTDPVEPGSVWRAAMSGTTQFAGFAGYIIAICNFQYGHGFAYITDNFGVGAPNTAQGYLALLIPDPLLLGARSAAANGEDLVCSGFFAAGDTCTFALPYGEGLGQ
jgi:hypothetical protein